MLFVKTFKGYEDKVDALDKNVNAWIVNHAVDVVSIETALSHEHESRAGSGDLVYTLVYRSDEPIG